MKKQNNKKLEQSKDLWNLYFASYRIFTDISRLSELYKHLSTKLWKPWDVIHVSYKKYWNYYIPRFSEVYY